MIRDEWLGFWLATAADIAAAKALKGATSRIDVLASVVAHWGATAPHGWQTRQRNRRTWRAPSQWRTVRHVEAGRGGSAPERCGCSKRHVIGPR